MKLHRFTAFGAILALASVSAAQEYTISFSQPSLDRWIYPYGSQPGIEDSIPVFGAILQDGFEDRDAIFLLGFETGPQLPTGLGRDAYQIQSLTVTLTMDVGDRWPYDPTADSVRSLLSLSDPDYIPDADPGTPVEMFAAGYRNGWTRASFLETSPFSNVSPFPPQTGIRNVYPALYDAAGTVTDLSLQVHTRLDVAALAIGRNPNLAPGQLAPADETLSFTIGALDDGSRQYLQDCLNDGHLRFVISSLEPASGGPGGGSGSPTYPAFYSKESAVAQILGYAAKLQMVVRIGGCSASCDFNQDGGVDISDLFDLADAIASGNTDGPVCTDFNQDGGSDVADIFDMADAIASGNCP